MASHWLTSSQWRPLVNVQNRRASPSPVRAVTKRSNHYEAAFEALLLARRVPYVAVDETRRSLCGERSIKSLDFIVSPTHRSGGWLVDVKGRRFPSGKQRRYWVNWSTSDDLHSLAGWEQIFGAQFRALLVFAYQICGDRSPVPSEQLFTFRGRAYAFVAMRLEQYTSWSRQISPKWGTVAIPARHFRQLAEPIDELLSDHLTNVAAASTNTALDVSALPLLRDSPGKDL